ncbi:30S ribosomal protein S3ae [Sulfolobus acidocaldarius]|uniref:Small ribosomal subunit protein eS1 n=5 Tax=Sulfolobus acidocaldarius TaxID=2285 RepID=RS3A_SULAC|nr:30S ribosomal protein S3ae [Sulfolobus acidocaldarius]Q4JB17.1 RecName: Full=Small ribosomal subunit protein eS1; AltName: Full=30S ribosomal protein S3Ae; AltName: Full=Ribosomal protein S1e [Sulfolobus acidocaldarius DSM 639]AAY80012.1 30S ribosomal protein S3AE [Sulfolobus acidocaldarius DSM 639]AGE70581.1 30S ribosomal protein S3Ae [Sulfolobus acidocaldarius N8]AGE72854.1 30S ribosomal protein S3Ae [Sulfolobus acidocaldarius Ron12/I]ALU29062.1 30S ribosomal protein S3Ae [Sulfolobus acid
MSSKSSSTIRDKWKLKKWYVITAPKVFGEALLGSTPAYDINKALSRKIEVTLYDLTGDYNLVYIHLYFKILGNISGDKLSTIFYGHELSRDYIRSLVRRKSSKINAVVDVTTKDGYMLRVKGLVLTTYRAHISQKTAIRKVISDITRKKAEESDFDQFVQDVIFGKLSNDIFQEAKKIYPLRKVEIEKTKLLKAPKV